MKQKIFELLGVEEALAGRVFILLGIGFFMGLFLATLEVGALTLFLRDFDEVNDLPLALLVGGFFGLVATFIYNWLQPRISFTSLGLGSLGIIVLLIGFSEFEVIWQQAPEQLYFFLFTFIVPFTFLLTLVFWGSFGRLFTLKQSKAIIGNIDTGTLVATIIGFFSIPFLLTFMSVEQLFLVSIASILCEMVLFIYMSRKYLRKSSKEIKNDEVQLEQLPYRQFFKSKYILIMCGFALVSVIAVQFVDYAFLNVTTLQFNEDQIAQFLALFEGTIVIFSFLFQTFITDRLIAQFGLRVSLLVTPVVGGIFVGVAFLLGSFFGYTIESETIIFFFLAVAMAKLLLSSLQGSLDQPAFKLYFLPVDSEYRFDVQTKVEGVFAAFANLVGGAIILLFTKVDFIDLIYIVLLAIPIIGVWYWTVGRMHNFYKETLQSTLVKNKEKAAVNISREYALDRVLEKEINSETEEKVLYGLKLMQRLEPALYESTLLRLVDSASQRIKQYAKEKIQELNIESPDGKDQSIRDLARQAQTEVEDSDLLSISPEKLMKLSKSVKKNDRMLAAKLLRKLISPKNIFILLELLRDIDPVVRNEALITARKVKRPETWPVLIELLSSPSFSHQAIAALKEAGEPALAALEAAFHKSGQRDLVMLKIVQIIGHIGGTEAMKLLWRKIDYPDKRIVKQIVYSLRYFNYRAKSQERTSIIALLETEVGKTIWNLAAINEIPKEERYEYLREALKEEVAENFDQITILMSILYDPESVQLVRDNVESGTADGVAFALELMDIFLDEELKPKLVPLFDDITIDKKIELLQIHFPRENYNEIQVINYIINRDFNQNNRWTKACAIHAAAYLPEFRVSRGLIGQMFNRDKLLQEVAAWVIYNKDQKVYETISERLTVQERRFLDTSLQNNQLVDGLEDGFFLWVEMVMFIKKLPLFQGISGSLLSDMSDKIKPIILKPNEKYSYDPTEENSQLFVVAHGDARLFMDENLVTELVVDDIIGDIRNEANPIIGNCIQAKSRCVIFSIDLLDFYFVLANHHELAQGLIRNVTAEEKIENLNQA